MSLSEDSWCSLIILNSYFISLRIQCHSWGQRISNKKHVCLWEREKDRAWKRDSIHTCIFKQTRPVGLGCQSSTLISTKLVHSSVIVSAATGHVSVCERVSVYVGLSMIWCLLQSASPQASVLPDCTLSTEQSFIAGSELSWLMYL